MNWLSFAEVSNKSFLKPTNLCFRLLWEYFFQCAKLEGEIMLIKSFIERQRIKNLLWSHL